MQKAHTRAAGPPWPASPRGDADRARPRARRRRRTPAWRRAARRAAARGSARPTTSAPLELGLALAHERLVRLAEVARVHADLLRLRLCLERLLERHGRLAVEHLLG